MTVEDIVGWNHQLDGHHSEQVLGVADGQGSLACCSPWVHKESYVAEQLNKNRQGAGIPEAGH